jgi:hypothetical protein
MAKSEKGTGTKGQLLYTEGIPKKLQPRKVLAGRRWSYLENLGRVAIIGFFIFILYQLTSTDLSSSTNLLNLAMSIVAVILLIYAVEVLSPRGRRWSTPIRIYSGGVQVHTSALEELRGYPSFISKDRISHMIVSRLKVNHEDKEILMPTTLKLALTNGKVLDLGRRNYNEIYNMVKIMSEKLGIAER